MKRPKKEDFKVKYNKGDAELCSVTKQYSKAQDEYIDYLEQLTIPDVVGRSEQLVAFCRWYNQAIPSYETTEEEIVETYLRESN